MIASTDLSGGLFMSCVLRLTFTMLEEIIIFVFVISFDILFPFSSFFFLIGIFRVYGFDEANLGDFLFGFGLLFFPLWIVFFFFCYDFIFHFSLIIFVEFSKKYQPSWD